MESSLSSRIKRVRRRLIVKNVVMDNASHSMEDRGDDAYMTPNVAVQALLGVERIPQLVWEPAAGTGNIAKALRLHDRKVYASDLVDRGFPLDGVGDFLAWSSPPKISTDQASLPVTCIVTNPPFKHAAAFAAHALTLVPNVFMLLRLNFMEGGQRDPIRDAVLDSSGLRHVHVFRERLPMMHREGWDGPRASSKVTFAWFCWTRGYTRSTSIDRISWKKPKPPMHPAQKKIDPRQSDMFGEYGHANPETQPESAESSLS